MFAEVAFDVESDDSRGAEASRPNHGLELPDESGALGGLVRLHCPGDKEFSCVAGTADDTNALYDPRLVNGDSWLTTECHCVRCETVRASLDLSALQKKSGRQDVVVVLLDLDNFGFNQFRSLPLTSKDCAGFDVINHMYVWCFFGSCFARYHGAVPDPASVCREDARRETSGNAQRERQRGGRRTVWQRLVAEGRCRFTPCGGQQQGADGVMLHVAHALTHMPVIVMSGDRELLRVAHADRRVVGKKAGREVAGVDNFFQLNVLNVLDHGKRFVPVWRALEEQVYQIVRK